MIKEYNLHDTDKLEQIVKWTVSFGRTGNGASVVSSFWGLADWKYSASGHVEHLQAHNVI